MLCTATVQAPVDVRLPGGATKRDWADTAASHPCRLMPVGDSAATRSVAEQLEAVASVLLVLPANTDLPLNARVRVSGATAGLPWERTLEPVGGPGAHQFEVERKLLCNEPEGL